jgi:hypothetical protein
MSDEYDECPVCGTPILAVEIRGPTEAERYASPQISTLRIRVSATETATVPTRNSPPMNGRRALLNKRATAVGVSKRHRLH